MGNQAVTKLRVHLGMTQAKFSEEIDIHPTTCSNIERPDAALIGVEVALSIVDRFREPMIELGMSLEDLLRGSADA